MKKKILTELSPKQIKLMETVRNSWLNRFFDCKLRTDRKKATKAINWLYKISGYEKPLIIFLSSPLSLQYGANMLKDAKGGQVWDQVWDQVSGQVRGQVWDQVSGQVSGQVWDQVSGQVSGQVRGQVWDQVSGQVSGQVRGQVWDQVRDQVWDQVRDQKLEFFNFCAYGSVTDYGWVSFYEYFTKIGVIDFEPFNNFLFLMKSNIYDMIQFEKVCLVSDMPTFISRNDKNQLSNDTDRAIKWADGYGQYWINGVAVTEKIVKTPEKLTKKDWLNEKNMEVRRIIQERMPDFVKKIGAKKIQEDNFGKLLEVDLGSDPEKIARYVELQDASTSRKYYLRIPPIVKTAKEGVSWSFGFNEQEYQPEVEA